TVHNTRSRPGRARNTLTNAKSRAATATTKRPFGVIIATPRARGLLRARRRPYRSAYPRGRALYEGSRNARRFAIDVDARVRMSRGPHADTRLCRDARDRYGRLCQELAAGVKTPLSRRMHREGSRAPPLVPFGRDSRFGEEWLHLFLLIRHVRKIE